jgi:hypothetical protein
VHNRFAIAPNPAVKPDNILIKKGKHGAFPQKAFGAGNEARTRDLNLGKVALYQLSYSRPTRSAIIDFDNELSSD